MLGVLLYWFTENYDIDETFLDEDQQDYANEMIPWLIYISSAVICVVQIIGLFIPWLMNNETD